MLSRQNALIVVLALSTAVTGVVAWQNHRRTVELEALSSADRTQIAELQTALRTHAARTASAPSAPAAPSEPAVAADDAGTAPAAPAESPDNPPLGERGRRNGLNRWNEMLGNPEFARAFALQQRGRLDARYGDLFKRLNLPPAQLERLKDLLTDRQTVWADVMAAAREAGLNGRENRDELRQLAQQAQAEIDAHITATIGPDGFAQLQQFERTQPQRAAVNQLEQRLSYTGTPLQPAQADQLIAILSETAAAGGTPGATAVQAPPHRPGTNGLITDAALLRAQGVLAPAQIEALRDLQAEQQAQRAMGDLLRRAGRGDDAGGG